MTPPLTLIAEPNRVEILRLTWARELSAGQIAGHFRVTFGAVSQHLRLLWQAGWLRRRREGKSIFYQADRAAIGPLAAALEAMWSERLGSLKAMAEAEQRTINRARQRCRRKRQ